MAVIVETNNPSQLLEKIRKAIDEKLVETWSYDAAGDFTRIPDQWDEKAWLRPQVGQGVLTFGLLGSCHANTSFDVYGLYHGRFIEMLLAHFDNSFSAMSATAMVDDTYDMITSDVE